MRRSHWRKSFLLKLLPKICLQVINIHSHKIPFHTITKSQSHCYVRKNHPQSQDICCIFIYSLRMLVSVIHVLCGNFSTLDFFLCWFSRNFSFRFFFFFFLLLSKKKGRKVFMLMIWGRWELWWKNSFLFNKWQKFVNKIFFAFQGSCMMF